MPCAVVESEEELQNLIEKIELDQGVKFVKHRQQHPTTTCKWYRNSYWRHYCELELAYRWVSVSRISHEPLRGAAILCVKLTVSKRVR